MKKVITHNPAYDLNEVLGKFNTPELEINVWASSLTPFSVLVLSQELMNWAIKQISNGN